MRRTPGTPRTHAWLQVGGSLTAQLRRFGSVRIVVLHEGLQALWPQERRDLHVACGYVREVLILVNERPAVWARSATLPHAVKGPWRALANLGSRPLAELLFHDRSISRSALRCEPVPCCSLDAGHIRRAMVHLPQGLARIAPRWARSSVFSRHGLPLRVYESFAPWVLALPCATGHAHAPR
ncbi:chorismate lyase [Curvibacter sp. APW13]|uniref:chorismate--pyruvate lyase family protein n=1 Tax=Curvibacter sp. APW13 TaxID=3077236 RepID=UPI0028DE5EBA|nr:chorismate lyase [Curvibacter sp. APW13]MDT8990386.1 chorismate lyase [Curvibacter sp. APW13]